MTKPTFPKDPATFGLYRFLPSAAYGPSPQNPAVFNLKGQVDKDRVKVLADQIVAVYLNSLPSNYVSQTKGPYYVQQFQAAAEELARIQVLLADAYEDNDFDFTRTEVLFQFLATLVFPDSAKLGLPEISGDITYREFLKRMVALLLQGSKEVTLVQGIEALTDANVELLARVKHLEDPGTIWSLADQFIFDVAVEKIVKSLPTSAIGVADHYHPVTINIQGEGVLGTPVYTSGTGPDHTHTVTDYIVAQGNGTGQAPHTHGLLSTFPDLPIILQRNVALVLQALDPAHTLYTYRNRFREDFRGRVKDQLVQADLETSFYEDFRHDCTGIRSLVSNQGVIGPDPFLFHDPTLSFKSVRVGAELVIPVIPAPPPTSGLPREHRYKITAVLPFPFGDDPEPRAYTTSPTGLSGFAKVENGAFVDTTQNFALCVPGEILTLSSGPNAGTYRLEVVTGLNGGPLGKVPLGPSTGVRPSPTYLRVTPRILLPQGTGVTYSIGVDRLGIRVPQSVVDEDASSYFFGPGASDRLFTKFGPLVKTWGDATPANVADVVVKFNGVPITVDSVNPYTGEITLAAPIAPFAPGVNTVTVTYTWFQAPVVGMAGLNTKGLTLNKWDLRKGRNTTSLTSGGLYGGIRQSRFPMAVVLGGGRRPQAQQIAHRFIGFQKSYTAALNSPTTMRLNQVPGRVSVPWARAEVSPTNFRYDGDEFPQPPWEGVGAPLQTVSDGLYSLADIDPTSVAYWKRDFPLPTATNVAVGARLVVNSYTPDGVFTGVGFGFHNNQRLYFAGALLVPNPLTGEPLRHLGILLRPGELSDPSSWTIGPYAAGQIQSPPFGSTFGYVLVNTADLPSLLAAGNKFQVLEGSQTGVYTVQDLFQTRTGKTLVSCTPAFPADPTLLGNRDVTLRFEAPWDRGLSTWRMYANTKNQTATVVFGGLSGSTTALTSGTLASPAYLGPDILPEGYGRVVWGSVDRKAINDTTWDFVRVASTPEAFATYSRGALVDTKWATGTIIVRQPVGGDAFTIDTSPAPLGGPSVTFTAGVDFTIGATDTITAANIAQAINASVLSPNFLSATSKGEKVTIVTSTSGSPGSVILFSTTAPTLLVLSGPTFTGTASDPEDGDWYLTTPFGDTRVSGSTVYITSTPASDGLGTSYGYQYTDPFLNGRRVAALDAKVSVQRDTAGAGGATLSIKDTNREARVGTIRWEDRGPLLGKRIFRTDTISLTGSVPYWLQSWDGTAGDFAFANGPEVIVKGDGVNPWNMYQGFTPYYSPAIGRFLEFRLSVQDYTSEPILGRIGLSFAAAFGSPERAVFVDFRTLAGVDTVVLSATAGGVALASAAIPWTDQKARDYLVTYNAGPNTVTLVVDGVLQATVPLAAFLASSLSGACQIQSDAPAGTAFTGYLRAVCYGGTDEGVPGLGRTFGLYKGGDPEDIDNWVLPRSDGLSVPNSDGQSVIIPMDWSSECWVRVFVDPTFGAAIIRPDLPPPPGYTGDFATQSMNPSAGWVRLEYQNLPRVTTGDRFGSAGFGALNALGSVASTWNAVRYRVFTNTTTDYTAPQRMVLNRWNVVTSNEFAKDVAPEEVIVAALTPTTVALRACHIFADRIFAVRVGGVTIPPRLYRFNKDSQIITLSSGLPYAGFPVTVVFAPGRPITTTYLQTQPISQSPTILNEGTPSFQMSQAGSGSLATVVGSTQSGSGGKTPAFPPATPSDPQYFLRDQYLTRQFADDTQYLYEQMEFFQLPDGGQRGRLSSYCDGPGPGEGVRELSVSGVAFSEFGLRGMGAAQNGRGPGTYRYGLMASGNGFNGGNVGTYSFSAANTVEAPFSGSPPVTTEAEPRMLYATSPSGAVVPGTDDGAIYRETLFVLRTGAPPGVVTIWTGGSQTLRWG